MKSINKNVIDWIIGNRYSKLIKNKYNNELEYMEITNNFRPKSRKQWTSIYGEELVKFLLKELNYNVRDEKPKFNVNNKSFELDIETDRALWEIKTRNWTTSGTAGEKILGTPMKYSEIPIISNKPLYIVVVAYQEYEAVNDFCLFEPKINDNQGKKEILSYINKLNIHYIKCSDLLYRYLQKNVINEIEKLSSNVLT